jgi:hypothetical protein
MFVFARRIYLRLKNVFSCYLTPWFVLFTSKIENSGKMKQASLYIINELQKKCKKRFESCTEQMFVR